MRRAEGLERRVGEALIRNSGALVQIEIPRHAMPVIKEFTRQSIE
jgi:hypothetical protein